MTIGDDSRAIWVASVPRTGSMWTYNVVRELVRTTGRQALPEIVPQADAEMEEIGKAGIAAGDGVYVLKVHTRIPVDLPHSFFIVTRRDLKDSVVSFMRFTRGDFDAGMRFVAAALRLEEHFAKFPPGRTLRIEYADIISNPADVVAALAQALAIEIAPAEAAAIAERYSKRNVEARLTQREEALREKIKAQRPVDVREFVPQPDRSLRAFDMETGFQSGHISAYREGDWRHILTVEQQEAIDALVAYAAAKQAGG